MINQLPAGVHISRWSGDKLLLLWTKVKDYAKIFSDDTRGDVEGWTRRMAAADTVTLEFPDGLLILSELRPGLKGSVHALFWDAKLRSHTDLVRSTILWAFFEYNLHRLSAEIPTFSKALRRWMTKDLGFTAEGVLRHDFWYQGELRDSIVLSLLREEVLNGN